MTITGMAISVEPAITAPQSVAFSPCWKDCSQIGRVTAESFESTMRARVYSFQANRNPNTEVEMIPGSSSGRVTRRKAPKREHPSTIAASSSSMGTPSTKPRIIQATNGTMVPM
ncbi:Uncharacterised protein [Mycobacterium tuberculosis]|nr:Uncharacterised protein [Mycobacterium tuberculosis]